MSTTTPKIKVKMDRLAHLMNAYWLFDMNESAECEWHVRRRASTHRLFHIRTTSSSIFPLQVYWVRVAGMASISNSTKYTLILYGWWFSVIWIIISYDHNGIIMLLFPLLPCLLPCLAASCCHEFYHRLTWPCVRDLFRAMQSAFAQHRLSCATMFDSPPEQKHKIWIAYHNRVSNINSISVPHDTLATHESRKWCFRAKCREAERKRKREYRQLLLQIGNPHFNN